MTIFGTDVLLDNTIYKLTFLGRIEYTTFIMPPIATDDLVAWCVCQFIQRLHCAKTAKGIDVQFGVETFGDPKHIMLDWGPDPFKRRGTGKVGKCCPLKVEGRCLHSMRPSPNYFGFSVIFTFILIPISLSTIWKLFTSQQCSVSRWWTWEDGAEENADAWPEVCARPGCVEVLAAQFARRSVRVDNI